MNRMAVAEFPGLAEVLVKAPADTLLSRLTEVLPKVVKESGDAFGVDFGRQHNLFRRWNGQKGDGNSIAADPANRQPIAVSNERLDRGLCNQPEMSRPTADHRVRHGP